MRRCPFFYRTIRKTENGIKPVNVLDGKLPEPKASMVLINSFSQHILHWD